jgi:hypothetical protein
LLVLFTCKYDQEHGMSHKLVVPAFISLLSVSALYALDEYMPISSRVMQINMGVEHSSVPGTFKQDWESNGVFSKEDPTSVPMQGKFGLMDQLEGSMAIRYLIQDTAGHTGLDRPTLGLKYGDPISGGGGYLAISLPIGFEDIMNAGNFATMTFGAMYNKDYARIKLLSNLSYSFNTEDDFKNKIDNIRMFVKAEYPLVAPWLTKNKQYVGLNLAGIYDTYFNRMAKGESLDAGGNLFQLAPGMYYTLNKIVSLEINVPFSISGQNQPENQTFRAQFYFTLDEGLYNTL